MGEVGPTFIVKNKRCQSSAYLCSCVSSPGFLHIDNVFAILWRHHEADAVEWDLWFGIHRAMEHPDWFCIGITCLVVAGGFPVFSRSSAPGRPTKSPPLAWSTSRQPTPPTFPN